MFQALKKILLPLALFALIVGAGAALQTPKAEADLAGTGAEAGVWFLDSYGAVGETDCEDDGDLREVRLFGTGDVTEINEDSGIGTQLPVIQIGSTDELIMCVQPADSTANVVFDTTGGGEWNDAHCTDLGTFCVDEEGVGDDAMTVVIGGNVNLDLIAVTFSCISASVQTIDITQDDASDEISFRIMCKGPANSLQLSVTPSTVESNPAAFNTSHSLIRAIITDAAGNPVLPTTDADITVSGCGVTGDEVDTLDERNEALDNEGTGTHDGINLGSINAEFGVPPLPNFLDIFTFSDRNNVPLPTISVGTIEVDTNTPLDGVPNHSEALAIFHAEGCPAGVYTVTMEINNPGTANDIEATAEITVIGPPAFITVTAAPTELVCGEKSEITVTVTDINNRPVSDNTQIEIITNWGGVFGGTGSSLTSNQPVNPLSSATVDIIDGDGIAFLLTSPDHYGPYEVLAASTQPLFGDGLEDTPRVTSQVTVTCTIGVPPTEVAPDTGTGSIRPPNTGEAGLAGGSVGSGTLLAIAGATFIALAAIARRRFAARD